MVTLAGPGRAQAAGESAAATEWVTLQREDTAQPFSRYQNFISRYPDWPMVRKIRANAERVMPGDLPAQKVVDFYRDGSPVSARGMLRYVRALQTLHQDQQARMVLNDWFAGITLTSEEQALILDQVRGLLDPETLLKRMDDLLMNDRGTQVRALAGKIGTGYVALVDARVALAKRTRDAEKKLSQVPAALRGDPGLMYERLRYRRRDDQVAGAKSLFMGLPDSFRPVNSRAMWNEQETLAEMLLDEGDAVSAYQVAARNFHDDRFARSQSMWLSGYIAYVHLKQPGRAFRHFDALYKSSLSPLTRARAAYWAGEASAKLGYPDVAQAWYRTSAAFASNFYGQLAATKLTGGQRVRPQGPPVATAEDKRVFSQSSLPGMVRYFKRTGESERAELFLNRMADEYSGQGGVVRQVVDLAIELDLDRTAIRISRKTGSDGLYFADHVFPVRRNLTNSGIEPALMFAIIRQESGFDTEAVSPSGALGLMQLMPRTAKEVAKQERASHKQEWLSTRPHHNVRLGTAYLRRLVNNYGGSYAIAAAAYNAGPGRASKWLAEYGDPRKGEISLVEWVERIPIYETRNYVQRILEGVAVYRQKLGTAGAASAQYDRMHLDGRAH